MTSVEKVTADMMKILSELKLEIVPKHGTELLQSHDKTLIDEGCLL